MNALHPSRAHSKSILVIRAGAIGDTLMATPLIRSLRRSFPDAYIAAVTSEKAADVMRFNPHLDDVFPIARRHLPIFFSREKRRIIKTARERGIDTVISLESNPNFTKVAAAAGAANLITYDTAAAGPGVRNVEIIQGEHSIEMNLRAGAYAGAEPAGPDMEMHFPPEAGRSMRETLAAFGLGDADAIVGIHAGWGSRLHHPTDTRLKSWPADRFAQVARWIYDQFGMKTVLTGTALDRELNDFIAAAAGVPVINAAGKFSLLESAALLKRMRLYLSIDSGPAHMAAALGTPLIDLWGPGIYTATRPLSEKGSLTILRSPPPCAPCYGTPLMKTCRNNICMKDIAVADVKAAAETALSNK